MQSETTIIEDIEDGRTVARGGLPGVVDVYVAEVESVTGATADQVPTPYRSAQVISPDSVALLVVMKLCSRTDFTARAVGHAPEGLAVDDGRLGVVLTEVRYDEVQKRVVYEPVRLVQEYRQFDFLSPWEGGAYALPGDEKKTA